MRRREVLTWLATSMVGVGLAWGLLVRGVDLVPEGDGWTAAGAEPPPAVSEPDFEADPRDWEIVQEAVRRARAEGLGSRAMGEVVAGIGLTFVGTPYEPGTLEVPGPERLVVNLRELDCVTFVENALVLARLVKTVPASVVEDRDALAAAYRRELARIRYRGGVLDGYASRLHYFSEWLSDNASRGTVELVTASLDGAVPDHRAITFMSEHPQAYRQIAGDPSLLDVIRGIERGLAGPRWYVPQEGIEAAAAGGGIRDGDIIAAKSTLQGLDVAHTGIALWQAGELHLLHAPLVGDSVEVSPLPLGERLRGIRAQDGILVARPVPPVGP